MQEHPAIEVAPESAVRWAAKWDHYAIESTQPPKLTEFHYYPRLPRELKMEIWKIFFESRGQSAHRFRLTAATESGDRLQMEPDKIQSEDASDWREILALARVDHFSFDWLMQLRRRGLVVYKDTSFRRRKMVEENGVEALIDPERDLVTFRFNYGPSLASLRVLDLQLNQVVFQGIKYVGLELASDRDYYPIPRQHIHGYTRGGLVARKCNPFPCPHAQEFKRIICPSGVVDFLRFFKDLKVVYFIVPISRMPFDRANKLKVERPYLRPEGSVLSPFRLRLFTQLENEAKDKNEERFRDRYGAYCRVHLDGAPGELVWMQSTDIYDDPYYKPRPIRRERGQVEQDFRPFCNSVRLRYAEYHTANSPESQEWRKTEFRYLAWADLRDVTQAGDRRPVRKRQPW